MNKDVTIVTGLWDLKRESIKGWGKRDFQQYKDRFFELLQTEAQMCIWIPKELEQEVLKIRGDKPTQIYFKELEDFKTWFPFFDKLQKIRTDPNWYNSAGWLVESPQAQLEYYNPMMMCKMFMVNDSAILNPFDSDYFYWIDGGITSTVNLGYFTSDKVFNNLSNYTNSINKFTFIQYPYEANEEIHGFERKKLAEFCNTDFVKKVSRGGFWGGTKEDVHKINALYYEYLQSTLSQGYMGADECLFTILSYKHPDLISNFQIEGNGLIWPFFENLKNYNTPIIKLNKDKVGLYVITYNSPSQFKTLIESFKQYDPNYLNKPKKFLLNNSTDKSTFKEYDKLCKRYGFKEIHKDNIGICGGRQFIAEHFNKQKDLDYYLFFEDDMFFYNGANISCNSGFIRKIPNLYKKSLDLVYKENFDFLKLNYTEFFGSNDLQWSWHNVSESDRAKLFPENPTKETNDVKAAPFLKYQNIKSYDGVAYATGEIYYCNWPQIVSREGNKKMFLETTWAHPYEQTWMSYIYQETIKGNINPGILLATPTEHDRFDFYPKSERREN